MKTSTPSCDIKMCHPEDHIVVSRTMSDTALDHGSWKPDSQGGIQVDGSLTMLSELRDSFSESDSTNSLTTSHHEPTSTTVHNVISRKSSMSSDNSSDAFLDSGDVLPLTEQRHRVNWNGHELTNSQTLSCPITDQLAPPPPPPLPPLTCTPALPGPEHIQRLSAAVTGVPRPRTSTKRLQWTKVPVSRVTGEGRPTVWTVVGRLLNDQIGSAETGRSSPDFDCLEQLFSVQTTSSGGIGTTGNPYGQMSASMNGGQSDGMMTFDRRKKPDEILLLDSKRIMNVSIFLRQFGSHVTSIYTDIVTWLREGCSELLGAERLRNLLKILPEGDELQLLTPYIEFDDKTRLGCAERFYLELMSVPHYELLVETLLLKEEFQTILDSIKPAIDAIILTARGIKDNRALHKILGTVLMAGNFLNSGAYAGEAIGFRLSSLLKLTEIRANKPQMNLMHYVAMEAEKSNEHVVEQLNRLKYLNEASQYSINTLHDDIRSLQSRVTRIIECIHLTESQFQQQIQPFLKMAKSEMETLNVDEREMEDLRLDLAVYFCEDEKTFRLDECISIFNTFCQKFIKAIDENRERHLLDEQAEQRRRQREEQLAMKKNRYGAPTLSISSSASYDDLLTSCTSTPTTYEPAHPGSLLSSMSLMKCSKFNVTRRQSTPIGISNTRCNDADSNDDVIRSFNQHFNRGSSMTFPESSGSTGDLTSAEDLVDALLKESTSASHLRPVGSPIIGGLGSPMFRRRKRNSGVQLVEPLTISRERTPSPRRAVNLNNDILLTPEIFVDNVPFTATADSSGGLEGDRDISPRRRTRTIDRSSPTRCRNVLATQPTQIADVTRRDSDVSQDLDHNSAEQQKKRDYEDRRLERRRQSDQVYQQRRADDVTQPAPVGPREVEKCDVVPPPIIPPLVTACPIIPPVVAMLSAVNSSSTGTGELKECEVNEQSKTIDHINDCYNNDSTVSDRRGSAQSVLSSGGKSLKERFQYLSRMYADSDNDDADQTSVCLSALRKSASASKLETTPSLCSETAVEPQKHDDATEYYDERNSQSLNCMPTATFHLNNDCVGLNEEATATHNQVTKNEDETASVENSMSSKSRDASAATESLQLATSAPLPVHANVSSRRDVKQHQKHPKTAATSVAQRRGGAQGQVQIKQTTNRGTMKTTVRYPTMTKSSMSSSRQSINAKMSTYSSAGLRTQKTADPVKTALSSLKTTTGRPGRFSCKRAVTRAASPCVIGAAKETPGRKIVVRQTMSATLTSPNCNKSACQFNKRSVASSPKVASFEQINGVLVDTAAARCPSSDITSPKTSSPAARQTSPKVLSFSGVADRKLTSSIAKNTTRRPVPSKSAVSRDRKSNTATTSDSSVSSTEESASPEIR